MSNLNDENQQCEYQKAIEVYAQQRDVYQKRLLQEVNDKTFLDKKKRELNKYHDELLNQQQIAVNMGNQLLNYIEAIELNSATFELENRNYFTMCETSEKHRAETLDFIRTIHEKFPNLIKIIEKDYTYNYDSDYTKLARMMEKQKPNLSVKINSPMNPSPKKANTPVTPKNQVYEKKDKKKDISAYDNYFK